MTHSAFIALGSNLQDPAAQIRRGLDGIAALEGVRMIRASSLYRTAPQGYDSQPDFINAVVEVRTSHGPEDLLRALLDIEHRHGRERPFPNAPRVLDLDLLLYDDRILSSATLTLPHPRMHQRGFVLLPLAEIAPQLIIPGAGTLAALVAHLPEQGVEILA